MSGLVDAQGRSMDPILTPKQNLALHQQARQMIQQGLQQLAHDVQGALYQQGLFLEFLTVKLQETVPEFVIDDHEFEKWAQARHEELRAEHARATQQEDQEVAAELLASGIPIQLAE